MHVKLVFLVFLMITLSWVWMLRVNVAVGSRTIVVPTDFPTIQDAINNAEDGDTIFVHAGTYVENLVVNKMISLVGENKTTTFVDGGGVGVVVKVVADSVSIVGFTVRNGGQTATGAGTLLSGVRYANISGDVFVSAYAGVSLVNSSLNLVQNSYVSGCNVGVFLNLSAGNTLQANTLANSTSSGVYLSNSPTNEVSGNSFFDDAGGVECASSPSTLLKNNSIVGSSGRGLRLASSSNCTVEENFLRQNGGEGLNVYSSQNCSVSRNIVVNNGFGILVQISGGTRLVGNVVTNNDGDGVFVSYSDNCLAQSNNVSGNFGRGLNFQAADSGAAVDNYVGNNNQSGILFYSSANGQVHSNVIRYNQEGIMLQSSPNATVSSNTAFGNARQGLLMLDSKNSTVSMNVILNSGLDGFGFQDSGNSTADGNTVCANAHYGMYLLGSPNFDILRNNSSSNGWDGVYLKDSNNSRILNNVLDANGNSGSTLYLTEAITFSHNNLTGNMDGLRIFLTYSSTISENSIGGNLQNGVSISNSTGDLIFHNSFVNNTANVVSQISVNTWDDGYPSGGNFWSDYTGVDAYWGPTQDQPGSDSLGDKPYTVGLENIDRYPLMTPSRFHDLVFENVTVPPGEIYVGWVFSVDVTVKNSGTYVETFNVTMYFGDAVVETRLVNNLTVGESYTAILTWDTSNLRQCSTYDLKAKISPVPVETLLGHDTDDFGPMKIKMVGDVNGDGKVDTLDVAAIATAFGRKVGGAGYRLNYDMNLDYAVNILDVSVAAKNCGRVCS